MPASAKAIGLSASLLAMALLLVAASRASAQGNAVDPAPAAGGQAAANSGITDPGIGRFMLGVDFVLANPAGAFSGVGHPAGLTVHFGQRLHNSISLGIEGSYLWYRSARRTFSLSSVSPETSDTEASVHTRSAMFLLHGRLRVQKRTGKWRPYVDGLFGFTDIFTRSSVEGPLGCVYIAGTTSCSRDNFGGATNLRDLVPSYGGGLGLTFSTQTTDRTWGALELSLRYLRGETADYVTTQEVRIENGEALFDRRRSGTNMVMVYAGAVVGWGGVPRPPKPVKPVPPVPVPSTGGGSPRSPEDDPMLFPTPEPTSLQAGVGILGATPTGAFATYVPDGAGGVLAYLDRALGDRLFSVGGEIGWMLYGEDVRKAPLSSLAPEVPASEIDIDTTNAILTLHSRLRVQPRQGRWRPYADLLLGMTDIYTRTTIGDNTVDHIQSRDFVLSYGAGGGVMFGLKSKPRAPRLDVGMRYMRGGTAGYLTEGAGTWSGNEIIWDFARSRTDMITLFIGIVFGR